MTPLKFIIYFIIMAVVLAVCTKIHGELPAGMHLATSVDTVIRWDRTPYTRALDSLDSVFNERARRDQFDKRRKRK